MSCLLTRLRHALLPSLLCLTLLIGCVNRISAQSACHVRDFTHELSERMVTDIKQDSRGFLWVSTWNGLHRFDGASFKHYKTYPGDSCVMASNRIRSFSISSSDKIWCLDNETNIYLFDPKKERFYNLPLEAGDTPTKKPRFSQIYTFAHHTLLCANDRLVQIDERELDIERGIGIRTRWYRSNEKASGIQRPIEILSLENGEICLVGKSQFTINERHIHPERRGGDFLSACVYEGRICLLTNRHLLFYAPKNDSFEWVQLPDAARDVTFVLSLDSKHLAIASHHGAWLYTPWNHRFVHIDPAKAGSPNTRIANFYADSHRQLWIHTFGKGVLRYDLESGEMQFLETPAEDIPLTSSDSAPFCFEDRHGTCWVLPREGTLGWFDYTDKRLKTYRSDPMRPETKYQPTMLFHYVDAQGNIWYTELSGLFRLSLQPNNVRYHTIDADFITRAVMTDHEGRLWVATKGGYVRIFNPDLSLHGYLGADGKVHRRPTPFLGNVYKIIEQRNGDLWMGMRLRGLVHLQRLGNDRYRIHHYRHNPNDPYSLSDDSIFDLIEDSRQRIWVCTYGGGINLLQHDASGRVRFLHAGNYFSNYPLDEGANVRTIHEKGEAMLVGTTNGLITFPFDIEKHNEVPFRLHRMHPHDATQLPANDVHSIFTDSRGESYVMTFTGGISRILSQDLLADTIRLHNYSRKDGLSSELAHTMHEDHQGLLWIISENAIDRFDPRSGSFESYGERLRSYTEATPTFLGNDLVVGTMGGIALIRTNELNKSNFIPSIGFSALYIQNTDEEYAIDYLNEVTLSPDQRDIQIRFSALDYTEPEAIIYEYRMQGLETEWKRVEGSHPAVYTNLPHGDYCFEVHSTNSDGVWVDNLRTLQITVTPTFWETPWALLLLAALVLITAFGVIQLRLYIYNLHTRIDIEQHMTDVKLRFFTDVSHELRTPLTLIAAPIDEVLREESLSEQTRKHLQIVAQNTQRMLKLINQILDFRKIENGKMKLFVEQVELAPAMQLLGEDFRPMAEHQRIDYIVQLPEEGMLGWIDRDKVEKICVNLLSNAFKYTPEGRKILFEVAATTDQLHIVVSDEGIGMEKSVRENLFHRFTTILGRTNFPSSGIGLSLVHELIQLMGGTIEVESTPGVGSCFTVTLPIDRTHYAALPNAELILSDTPHEVPATISTATEHTEGEERATLLIVEDNEELRQLLSSILGNEYRICTAENGQEGLEQARQIQPDLILSDVMMPVMDGLEMVKQIKADRNLSHLPIVILSAKSDLDDRIQGLEQGIDDYLTKPFVASYLKVRIRQLLERQQQLRERFLHELLANEELTKRHRVEAIEPSQPHIVSSDERFMQTLILYIEEQIDNTELTIEDCASHLHMAHSTFYNKVKTLIGITPVEFVREIRLKRGRQLLLSGEYDISTVSYMVGFSDSRYFSKCFKKRFGISPSQVRK